MTLTSAKRVPALSTLILLVANLLWPTSTPALDYPTKAIRFIVPFPASGAGDMVARALGQRLGESLHQSVVIDNRSGAGGTVGVQVTAKAAPDGYTLLLCTSSTQVIGPILQPNIPYDPIKDFTAITLTVLLPNILVAHPSAGVSTLAELIKFAKAKPGQLGYASNGNGTSSHLAGELLKREAGINLVHVPYKGAGIAINDALGSHVPLLIGGLSTSLPHVKSGRLRSLAIMSLKRSAAAPDIPTAAESGLPGFEVIQWFGLSAPAGLPKPILARLNEEARRILSSADFRDRMVQQGIDVMSTSSEEFRAFIQTETRKWSRILKDSGIHIDPAG